LRSAATRTAVSFEVASDTWYNPLVYPGTPLDAGH